MATTAALGLLIALAVVALTWSSADEAGTIHRPPVTVLESPGEVLYPTFADAEWTDTVTGMLSVTDAAQTPAGWAILDAAADRIHLVREADEREGRALSVLSVGREGEGPGEFRMPLFLSVSRDQIGVLEADGTRLVRFRLDGEFQGPVALGTSSCPFGPAQGLAADPEGGFLVLRSCTGSDLASRAVLIRVSPGGEAEELADLELQDLDGEVDPFRVPVVGVVGTGRYLGTLGEGCLVRIGRFVPEGDPGTLCRGPTEPLPLPDSLRQRILRFAEAMAATGRQVAVPEALPPFVEVTDGGDGMVLRIPLAGGGEALEIVHTDQSVTHMVPETGHDAWVGHSEVLLFRAIMSGTELARVSWR